MRLAFGVFALLTFSSLEARAECLGRPTDATFRAAKYEAGTEEKTLATARTLIHWVTTGDHAPALASSRADGAPDTVGFAADAAEAALTKYAELGYRALPSDGACRSNGGDDKVDIYLVKFAGADGSTLAECGNGPTCSSFILVDSTFTGRGYANPQEGFRTVVAHELFHAVQNTYKTNDAGFWAEGTAQWAMKTVYPDLQDFERLLPGFFADTSRSLDAPPAGVTAGFLYGSAVWPLFLSMKHGPETIREIYEAEAEGADALAATDAVLQKKGASLAADYPLFAAFNAGTKIPSSGGYPDAAKYPGIKMLELTDGVAGITSGLGYFAYRGTANGTVTLDTDPTRNGGVLVPIEDGKVVLEKAQPLPAKAAGEVIVVVAGVTTKKTDAPFTLVFSAGGGGGTSTTTSSCQVGSSSLGNAVWMGLLVLFFCGSARTRASDRSRHRV